ncbi:MAG: DoxX family protein [Spirochaetes bacterium]|nr:DoxX family protein [Spirochaetota bacterium]
MNQLFKTIGRIIFVLPIAVFGLFHFLNGKAMTGIVPGWLPFPLFWVYFTGVIHIVAAVFIIGKFKYANYASLILSALILFYVLFIHLPVVLGGGPQAQMSMMSLLKDLTMAGGLLFFAGYLSEY